MGIEFAQGPIRFACARSARHPRLHQRTSPGSTEWCSGDPAQNNDACGDASSLDGSHMAAADPGAFGKIFLRQSSLVPWAQIP
jgi:hypothetical protein